MALLNYLDSLVGSLGLGEKEMNEGVHEQNFFCMIWVIWQLQNGSSRELWNSIFPSVQDPSWVGSHMTTIIALGGSPHQWLKTNLFLFIFGGDLGQKGILNFKALWRSHFVTIRWPISYRIRFMTFRTFFFHKGGWVGGVRSLMENSTNF